MLIIKITPVVDWDGYFLRTIFAALEFQILDQSKLSFVASESRKQMVVTCLLPPVTPGTNIGSNQNPVAAPKIESFFLWPKL